MKSFDLNRIVLVFLFFSATSCVKDEIALPSIECNQPDLVVNKRVEDIRNTASGLVTQYKFNDVIEAYVVSTDEFGNFSRPFPFKLWPRRHSRPLDLVCPSILIILTSILD